MKSRPILLMSATLAFLFLLTIAAPVSANSFCEGGTVTTLRASGVPNLYRLGLQRGVPWPNIAAASGITNVQRVFPDQALCVPGASTMISTTTQITTVTTTTTTTTQFVSVPPGQPTTPAQAISQQPDISRCNALMINGQPADRGSCILEVIGGYRVIEVVASCEPNSTRIGSNDIEEKCSATGTAWIRIN